jgi:Flp pilus assembly protein TadG
MHRIIDKYRVAGSRGGALVELTVCLPILTLVLVGTADLGRVWTESSRISTAAYAGAQYAAQSRDHTTDEDGIRQIVLNELGFPQFQDPNATEADGTTSPGFTLGAYQEGNGGGDTTPTAEPDESSLVRRPSDYDINVSRYCECSADNSETTCEGTNTCIASGRKTYTRIRVGMTFETIIDYPGIPGTFDLTREVRLRAR